MPAFSRKKSRFSGKEEGEARQVDLQIVDLDLGEVRVVGQIERHGLAYSPLDVESAVEVGPRSACRRLFGSGTDQVGLDVETARAPEPREAGQAAGQGNAIGRVVGYAGRGDRKRGTGQIRPVHFFALAADEPLDVQPPAVERRIEAQGCEGNRDLRRPAFRRPSSPDGPHTVPLHIHVAPLVGDQRIVTGAVRIRGEGEGVAAVEKRVEDQNEGVVGGEFRVALHLLGDDPLRLPVEGAQRHVERRLGVGDGELGPLRGRRSLAGFALAEAVADLGLPPGRIVEQAVQDDRLVDGERRDRGTLAEIGVDLTGRRRADCQRDDDRSQHRPDAGTGRETGRKQWRTRGTRESQVRAETNRAREVALALRNPKVLSGFALDPTSFDQSK